MSYEKEYGHLAFFIPNIPLATTTAGVMREMDIGASSADHGEYVCIKNCLVKRLGFIVTGEIPVGTTTAPTVIFTKRPTPLSATGEAVVETLVIPTSTAIGKVIYLDFSPVEFAVGDSVEISWTIGVDGTVAGKGHAFFLCQDSPEVAANNTDMIASA